MFGRKTPEAEETPVAREAPRDASFIEDGLTFTGNTVTKGNRHVEGEIQGDVQCAKLSIGEKGRVTGTVTSEEVVVAGNLKGTINGASVTLKPGCHVDGDIIYQTLEIEHGAHFEGKSKRTDNPVPGAAKGKAQPSGKPAEADGGNGKLSGRAALSAADPAK